jgi:hypothetical protein
MSSLFPSDKNEPDHKYNNNVSHRRKRQELSLVQQFYETVIRQGREMIRSHPQHDECLTPAERRVLGVRTYHNWTAGLTAGATTFVVLLGGLRWRSASKRLKEAVRMNNSGNGNTNALLTTKIKTANSKSYLNRRPSLQELEGTRRPATSKQSSTTILSTTTHQQQQQKTTYSGILSDDVVAQIQFMCVGAFAIVMSSIVARLAHRSDEFLQDLSQLPLQAGQSHLMHSLCPAVLTQYEELLLVKDCNNNDDDSSLTDDNKQVESSYSADALFRDPTTAELEHIQHLITNCRLRMEYERQHGGSQQHPLVVPESGVPVNKL